MTDNTQPEALAADHSGDATDMVGRWYMVNKDGMATLCTDKADAEKEAADAQRLWPNMGPHRAVQLVEASFDAAAEVAKLKGQRMVLCSLLGECRGHLEDAAHVMHMVEEEMPVWDLVERIESALKAISEDQVKGGES